MGVHLYVKFEVSSIILTGFRRGGVEGGSSSPPPQNELRKSLPRLGLSTVLIIL